MGGQVLEGARDSDFRAQERLTRTEVGGAATVGETEVRRAFWHSAGRIPAGASLECEGGKARHIVEVSGWLVSFNPGVVRLHRTGKLSAEACYSSEANSSPERAAGLPTPARHQFVFEARLVRNAESNSQDRGTRWSTPI
jgi:hypothetical protein